MFTVRSASRAFLWSESGAVASDWTVIAAVVCSVGFAGIYTIRSNVAGIGSGINAVLSATEPSATAVEGGPGARWVSVEGAEAVDVPSMSDDNLRAHYAEALVAAQRRLNRGDAAGAQRAILSAEAVMAELTARGLFVADLGAGLARLRNASTAANG